MKSRDKLKKATVKHKSPATMSCYKKARNAVNNLNVSLKKEYFTNKIIEHKGDIKETWKITRPHVKIHVKSMSRPHDSRYMTYKVIYTLSVIQVNCERSFSKWKILQIVGERCLPTYCLEQKPKCFV